MVFLFGIGGITDFSYSNHTTPTGYGSGGRAYVDSEGANSGGGGAACAIATPVTVTPGTTYNLTIGAAGTNTQSSIYNGTPGWLNGK